VVDCGWREARNQQIYADVECWVTLSLTATYGNQILKAQTAKEKREEKTLRNLL
jgi:hypothetical protein